MFTFVVFSRNLIKWVYLWAGKIYNGKYTWQVVELLYSWLPDNCNGRVVEDYIFLIGHL